MGLELKKNMRQGYENENRRDKSDYSQYVYRSFFLVFFHRGLIITDHLVL